MMDGSRWNLVGGFKEWSSKFQELQLCYCQNSEKLLSCKRAARRSVCPSQTLLIYWEIWYGKVARVRKFFGYEFSEEWNFQGAKVIHVNFSLTRAKSLGSEKSRYPSLPPPPPRPDLLRGGTALGSPRSPFGGIPAPSLLNSWIRPWVQRDIVKKK